MKSIPQSLAANNKLEFDDLLLDQPADTKAQKRHKEEGDFLYGHVSGTTLEEFVVTKINKKNKPCEKILCIDGFNIWHRHRKEAQ